jgi:hypothetical protein
MTSLPARWRSTLTGVVVVALTHVLSWNAHAEVSVEGRIDAVSVEARDASVRETLDALSTTFGLLVRGFPALDRRLNGSYRGSLQQVIARLLAGDNYVIVHSGGNLEIRIYSLGNDGNSKPVATPSGEVAVPARVPTRPAGNLQELFNPYGTSTPVATRSGTPSGEVAVPARVPTRPAGNL